MMLNWKCALAGGLLLAAGAVNAAEDVAARAMQLYELHHYEEAARLLRPELPALDAGRQAYASLALGMIYLGSAQLYRELYQTALVIEGDYLSQLARQKTAVPSRYVDLYLGQVLLESGKPGDAQIYLRRFAAQKAVAAGARAWAGVETGLAQYRQKQLQKALQEWSALGAGKPEARAALAGVYAMAGVQDKKPLEMADAALKEMQARGQSPGARMNRDVLRAYSYGGATDRILDWLYANELDGPSHIEELGTSKSISFYDSSVLGDLSRLYLDAAVRYLQQAGRDQKFAVTASFYLASAYLQQGRADAAQGLALKVQVQSGIPAQIKHLAGVTQAAANYRLGKRAEAEAAWGALVSQADGDVGLFASVMLACADAAADCGKLENRALAAVEKGEGRKFFALNAALGKYYLARGKYAQAFQYLEAGRDKANKNKIEANDPLLLVSLAEACYRNKKFSENLEIYFELGKQFPAVRQIQDAMQGIYAMEHQSAGEVKIF